MNYEVTSFLLEGLHKGPAVLPGDWEPFAIEGEQNYTRVWCRRVWKFTKPMEENK